MPHAESLARAHHSDRELAGTAAPAVRWRRLAREHLRVSDIGSPTTTIGAASPSRPPFAAA
jgi:hypothetical protein